jgi:hypothetical protein
MGTGFQMIDWKKVAHRIKERSDLYLMGMEANALAVNLLNEVKQELHEENKKLRMHINEHAPGTLPPELR